MRAIIYVYSIATIGCNFKCGFCQNWQISQRSKRETTVPAAVLLPETIVAEALHHQCSSIAYTYTEPTIFVEYAYDTAVQAAENGLYNIFVTNGFMTPELIDMIRPYLHAANIDLKSFSEEYYQQHCKARLSPVLDSIRIMKQAGI